MYEAQRHTDMSMSSNLPSTSMICEHAVPQQHLCHDSVNISDDRLSPNLFLNLNFDHSNTLDSNVNSLKFEWSFNPNLPSTSTPSILSPVSSSHCKQQSSYMPGSPSYEFLNVDHFDNFKNECILTLDNNLLSSVGDGSSLMGGPEARSMDLQSFSLNDDHKELLDLEKPININVASLDADKY